MPLARYDISKRLQQAAVATAALWHWWLSELRSLFEDWILSCLPSAGVTAQISMVSPEVVLARRERTGLVKLSSAAMPESPELLSGCVKELVESTGIRIRRLDIALPPSAVLVRRMQVPVAVGAKLRESMRLQLDRLMPLTPDRVYFDCQIVGRPAAAGKLDIDLAIVRRELVDALRDAALGAGVKAIKVMSATLPALVFLKAAPAKVPEEGTQWHRWLTVSAVLLAIAILIGGGIRWHLQSQALESNLAVLRVKAKGADQIQQALTDRGRRLQFFGQYSQTVALSQVLAALTDALPNDAWLYNLQFEGPSLRISGVAKDASALVVILAKSALFTDVSLRSATAGADNSGERFEIALSIKDGEKKSP